MRVKRNCYSLGMDHYNIKTDRVFRFIILCSHHPSLFSKRHISEIFSSALTRKVLPENNSNMVRLNILHTFRNR
jgi:hypothetical protein